MKIVVIGDTLLTFVYYWQQDVILKSTQVQVKTLLSAMNMCGFAWKVKFAVMCWWWWSTVLQKCQLPS